MKRKFLLPLAAFALCFSVSFSAAGCDASGGKNDTKDDDKREEIPLDTDHGVADRSKLYGICYLIEDREYTGSPFTAEDFATDFQLIANLGAKTVRHWMHFTYLMKDKDTMNEEHCATMHAELEESTSHGITNIGMNHHNFNNGAHSVGKVRRNLATGSYYKAWLEDYYTSWYNLVSEFPEVEYWEIDNEPNNPDFMYSCYDKTLFDSDLMAAIFTDMLYYATRAIHEANPEAKSVMGGLTEPMGQGKSDETGSRPSDAWFLQKIYDNIFSGEYGYFYSSETNETASVNPDDYFDVAAWHPYRDTKDFDADYFVAENHKVYQTVLDNEHKHKKVFITEVGYSEAGKGADGAAANVIALMKAVEERMPYVETVNIFRMFDNADTDWAAHGNVSRFGFFADPNPDRAYMDSYGTRQMIAGEAKDLAVLYQKAAGGTGDLNLLKNYYTKRA